MEKLFKRIVYFYNMQSEEAKKTLVLLILLILSTILVLTSYFKLWYILDTL